MKQYLPQNHQRYSQNQSQQEYPSISLKEYQLEDQTTYSLMDDEMQRMFEDRSAEDLFTHLTNKFNKLLTALKNEENLRISFQKQLEQVMQSQQLEKEGSPPGTIKGRQNEKSFQEGTGLKGERDSLLQRNQYLLKELNLANYERKRLEEAFEDMRKKIEERVPVIALVEKRRLDLERDSLEQRKEMKNLQEQLREALKKCSKLQQQVDLLEKDKKELSFEIKGCKERMNSLRKLNQQHEGKIKQLQEELQQSVAKNGQAELEQLRDRCEQLTLDNGELTRHLRMLIEHKGEGEQVEGYKQLVGVLESKIAKLAKENLILVQKLSNIEEESFISKNQQIQGGQPSSGKSNEHSKRQSLSMFTPLQQNQKQIIKVQENPSHHIKQHSQSSSIYTQQQQQQNDSDLNKRRRMQNFSQSDFQSSLAQNDVDDDEQIDLRAITERCSENLGSNQQTFGGDDLAKKLSKSGRNSENALRSFNSAGGDKDDMDDVLSLKPEVLDIESLDL